MIIGWFCSSSKRGQWCLCTIIPIWACSFVSLWATCTTELMIKSMTSTSTTNLQARSMKNFWWTKKKSKLRNQKWWTFRRVTYFMWGHLPTTCTNSSLRKTHASSTYAFQTILQMATLARSPTSKIAALILLTWEEVWPSLSITRLPRSQCPKDLKSMKSITVEH